MGYMGILLSYTQSHILVRMEMQVEATILFRVQGFRSQGLGFGIWGLGFQSLGFGIWGLGIIESQDSGFGVSGFRA